MVRFLPPWSNIDDIKKQAKLLQKAHRRRDPDTCAVLRNLRRFGQASDEDILSAKVPLTEVQFALALEYGFGSWRELRSELLARRPAADYVADAKDDALTLPDPTVGITDPDRYASAFSMALSYLEAPTDYETVSGDTGLAFILQADARHRYPLGVKHLDMGWWPLDEWGLKLRLDFLGRVSGVPVRQLPSVVQEYKADAAGHYREHHEAEVAASLQAGRPVVASVGMDIAVIFGMTQAAISYRLDRGIQRIRFLLSIPQVTEADLRRDLPGAFPQAIDVDILVGMWETTCQSEVASQLKLTQGRVRHRFFKAVKTLETAADDAADAADDDADAA
ncbi:hypothetical protein LCGC14_1881600, partial [marine sediment metagenome]